MAPRCHLRHEPPQRCGLTAAAGLQTNERNDMMAEHAKTGCDTDPFMARSGSDKAPCAGGPDA